MKQPYGQVSRFTMIQAEERKTLTYESCSSRGYEIDQRIGQGGFGMVFRARQPAVGRQVAVKMILPHYADEEEFVERFDEEAKLVARLEHPHIVPLYDYWRGDDGAYLVMRWLNGGNLYESLQKKPWDIHTAANLLDQIAGALSLAHKQDVIHRDIKPENIMLDETGNAYLTDFGIAKDLIEGSSKTAPGIVVGSLLYIAPEQVQGKAASPHSDIYSLGIVMYELITGEHPFSSSNKASQIAKVLSEPIPLMRNAFPNLPEAVDDVIQRVTAKEPEQRYPDALAFSEAFRQAVLGVSEKIRVIAPAQPVVSDKKPTVKLPAFLDDEAEFVSQVVQKQVFVARENELEKLTRYLEQTLQKNGQVVFVSGGPGRGKTALADEFSRRAMEANPDLLVASGSCNAYADVGEPYLPFREVLGMLTGDIEPQWTAGRITTNQARRSWNSIPLAVQAMLDHGPNLPGIFLNKKILLSRVTSSVTEETPWVQDFRQEMDSQQNNTEGLEQSYIFEQFTNVLRALTQHHPLILILDDMQWADTASVGLLFHLGRRLEGLPIQILCTYRPEEVAIGRASTQIDLEKIERHPLEKLLSEFKRMFGDIWIDLSAVDHAEERKFVDALLDEDPSQLGEEFRDALFKHTNGHPLFTIELLRAMQERGDLVKQGNAWTQGPSLDWETLPAKVEGVIEERISRLDDELVETLSIASIEGMNFTPKVVASVLEIGERGLLRQLSRDLEARHRLVKEQDGESIGRQWLAKYRFTHAMIHQHIYTQISEGERRWLHTSVGEILEEIYAGYVDSIAARLMRHFKGDPIKELKYLEIAGNQAAFQFANKEALSLFDKALELIPENNHEVRFGVLLSRERVFDRRGDRLNQRKDLKELSRLVEIAGTPKLESGKSEVATRWARYTILTDNIEAASLAEKAVAQAGNENRKDVAVEAYTIWAEALRKQGDLSSARMQAEAGLALARENDDMRGESGLLNSLGLIALEKRDMDKALEYFKGSLSISHQIGNRQQEAQTINNLANIFGIVGDYENAGDYYQQALDIAREMGNRRGEGLVLGNLGWIASIQGDYSTASSYYEQNLNIARETDESYLEAYAAINLCMSTMWQGEYSQAMKYAKRGRKLARETGDRSGEAWALTFLGHVCLEMGYPDEADDSYQNALLIRKELEQKNLSTEPLAGLARVSQKRREMTLAQEQVNKILTYLDGGGTLDGVEEPLRVWLTCYQVLQEMGDSRVEEILENAHELLQKRASEIKDKSLRSTFLEKVPHHAEIVRAWEESQNAK